MSTFEQDIDEINQFECEEVRERTLSEVEYETNTFMYERFVVDDDEAGSDIFSDCENIESDTEYTSEHCDGQSDDMLFAGAPISSSSRQVLCSYYLLYSNTSLLVKHLVIYLLLLKLTSPDQTIVKQQPESCLNL